ncbi:MAG TPA: hypothetical protein VJ063_16115 [Verrucomicrobiae bacterium]|nr:hypothetical protein [Verrucomicrobiae bacterium]
MKKSVAIAIIAAAVFVGCRSAKPPPVPAPHVEEAQRAAAQAAKFTEGENWPGAAKEWGVAADLYLLLNDRTNVAMALHNQGQAYREAGDYQSAEGVLTEAAKINQELESRKEWFRNYLALAQVAANANETNAIAQRLEALAGRIGEVDDAALKGTFHNEVGLWRLEQRRFSDATEAFKRAADYFAEAKNKLGSATVIAHQAKVYEGQRNYPAAMDNWQAALGEFETLANPAGIAYALTGLGRTLLLANQDLPKAEDLLRRAAKNYRTLKKGKELREAESLLAKCLKAQGKTE